MKKLVVVLTAGIFISCTSEKKEVTKIAEVDSYAGLTERIDSLYQQGYLNGFGVAIASDSGLVYSKGFGYRDKASGKPYTNHTVQNIASISKTLIGLSLVKAQEMGKLQLDDPVNNYLPFEVVNPNFPEAAITIRQLATHTSSIQDNEHYNDKSYVRKDSLVVEGLDAAETFNPPSAREPMVQFLEKVLSTDGIWYREDAFTTNEPGVLFEYTNVGATLAAAVLEIAVDTPYYAFTQKHILEPLSMKDSGWSFDAIDMEMHTLLYADTAQIIPHYSLITYPDGGFLTSPHDMGLYLSELIKGYHGFGTLVSADSYRQLFSEELTEVHLPERDSESPFNDEYNSGIFMGHSAFGYMGHTGGDPGVSSLMFFNPETKNGAYIVVNTDFNSEESFQEFVHVWESLYDEWR